MIDRPNCSLTPTGRVKVFAVLAGFSLMVAFGFTLAGAWLVFPFAGLELIALGYAFLYVGRHAEDYESITVAGDKLIVMRHTRTGVCRLEFQRYWVQVVLRGMRNGEVQTWLRSHGKEVEVGRYMNAEQRQTLARQLRQHTGAAR